jgi:hypothetical protein
MLPSQRENSDPGSVDISAGSPVQSCKVKGWVNARKISSGVAGIEKYFLNSFIILRQHENKDLFPLLNYSTIILSGKLHI